MESLKKQLGALIEEGEGFTWENFHIGDNRYPEYAGTPTPKWTAWTARVKNLVSSALDETAGPISTLGLALAARPQGEEQREFTKAKTNFLGALRETLRIVEADTFNELSQPSSKSKLASLSNKIFVVHGHDNELKVELERFIIDVGLEPIVLHREPDEGQTIIEKFEKHSDVGYAFVLLTPDEIAYTADQTALADEERNKEKRARPNVIFEFGYFTGRLGRSRVCCLYKGDVVLPSDLNGLVYKNVDDGIESQGFSIIKELKAAGYRISI